ncbi:MAG: transposase [Hadesarchaea archaeon]|nr:transposase [Hadesarchaea archaeon]
MVCPEYHATRHSSRLDDVKLVYKHASRLVRRVPPPWPRAGKGRPPKFSARRHAAICITARCLDLTYREVEGQAPFFLRETVDHSTIGWALKRMGVNYVKLLLALLRRELQRLVRVEFYTVDTTGISTPRLKRRVKAFRRLWEREFLKLHALVGYSRRASALFVVASRVTKSNVTDGSQLGYLLRGLRVRGEPLLADAAYHSKRNLELAVEHGFKPVIKPRSYGYHGLFWKRTLREFKRAHGLYRSRGIAEAVFAGLANRYHSHTRYKRGRTKTTSILLMLVAHNLRTLVRVRAMKRMGILFIQWIYSTNPTMPKNF